MKLEQIVSKSGTLELNDKYYCYNSKDIDEGIKELENYLITNQITKKDFLVWECNNSIVSTIAILYFLTNNYSFFLVPANSEIKIPNFCRYILKNSPTKTAMIDWQISNNLDWNEKQATPNRAYLYVRTSGTTGKPKLIAHSHEKLWQNALNCSQILALNKHDRISIPVPIYHLFGLGAGLLPAVLVGASIDLQVKANILTFLQREKLFNPNVAFMTPSFARTLLKTRKSSRHYRFTVMAGDRVLPDTFDRYQELFGKVVTLYGSSEMGVIAIANSDESTEVRKNTVGKPLLGVEIKLKERQKINQLLCRHQYGFSSYLDDDGNWLDVNNEKDWFPTKDLAQIDKDGYLKILGRSDSCVNRDGLLVLLTDIEKAIETITGVETAITVVTTVETNRGKQLKSYCLLEKNSQLTAGKIRSFCFDLLPRRAIPDRIVIVSSLPLLPNGKVARQQLSKIK